MDKHDVYGTITFNRSCNVLKVNPSGNQRTSGPVNAHLKPGLGIYFNDFIQPRAGADNSLGINVDINRKPLSLCPFEVSFKKEI